MVKRAAQLQAPSAPIKITVVRLRADPERRAKIVRLLSEMLDSPRAPGDGR